MPLALAHPHQIRSLQQAPPAMRAPCTSKGAWQLRRQQSGAPLGRAPMGLLTLDPAASRKRATPGRWEAARRRMRLGRQHMKQVRPTWAQQLKFRYLRTCAQTRSVFL